MTKKVLTTPVSDADIESLKIGDVFYLSGALITSRDMVHFRHVEEGMDLPYDLAGKAIFHAGPIMVPDDKSRSGFRVVCYIVFLTVFLIQMCRYGRMVKARRPPCAWRSTSANSSGKRA